ncbi:hypothetical protein PENTCL1PPCAC_1904, partial [Pristionchus entomophagus]
LAERFLRMAPPSTDKCTTPPVRSKSSDCQRKKEPTVTEGTRSVEVESAGTLILGNPVTTAFWPRVAESKDRHRLIFVMRNAERIDRVFGPDWLETELAFGKFLPTDQNIPSSLKHLLPHTNFIFDPPITTMGKYTSQLVARAMTQRGASPKKIVCAPALRCVQTASAIASLLNIKCGIEYGLAEPPSWFSMGDHQLSPEYISPEKFASLGYAVDPSYSPVFKMEMLKHQRRELEKDSKERIDFVLRYLSTEDRSGLLLVVGHALTCQIAVEMTTDKPGKTGNEWDNAVTSFSDDGGRNNTNESDEGVDTLTLGIKFPYGAVISLARANTTMPYRYRICRNLIPPLTCGRYFNNKPVLD